MAECLFWETVFFCIRRHFQRIIDPNDYNESNAKHVRGVWERKSWQKNRAGKQQFTLTFNNTKLPMVVMVIFMIDEVKHLLFCNIFLSFQSIIIHQILYYLSRTHVRWDMNLLTYHDNHVKKKVAAILLCLNRVDCILLLWAWVSL